MRKGTVLAVFFGVAGLALASPGALKEQAVVVTPGSTADFMTTVNAIREVPAGNPMPGLHIDTKVNGRALDIYIAPMDFVMKFGIKVAKGNDIHIVGAVLKGAEADVVLAREIETGIQTTTGFRPRLTIYLRNDDGPFWVDNTVGP
ncbi:MAG TPA: hypothetical protein VG273_27925 [Bryobacteraceae bacterium]|nr:hypothetical protein [Bryobacteraceae bacterium]